MGLGLHCWSQTTGKLHRDPQNDRNLDMGTRITMKFNKYTQEGVRKLRVPSRVPIIGIIACCSVY